MSDEANEIFGGCQAFDSDWSLDALIRAIVLQYSEWTLETLSGCVSINKIRVRTQNDIQNTFTHYNDAVLIVECINCLDEDIVCPDGWIASFNVNGKAFKVNDFLSQYARTRIFTNADQKRIIACVDRRANHVWIQAFESVLPRLMTWYFPLEIPEETKAFYRAIAVNEKAYRPVAVARKQLGDIVREGNGTRQADAERALKEAEKKYEQYEEEVVSILCNYVNSIAEKINFRAIRLHRMLDGIADRARQSRMRDLKSQVESTLRSIRDYRNTIADYYRNLDAFTLELNGLEALPPEKNDAMFNFFNNHKQITILDVADSELRFGVEDTLEFYDEDEFERVFKGGRSYLSNHSAKVRKALWAIFKERRGVIRIQATFKLRNFKLVEPIRNGTFVDGCMPNPHIYYHACSGGNETYYYQYAESGDWDLGVEQAISATKNLNWGDSTVCSEMVSWLKDNDYTPCIYVADGFKPIDKVEKGMKLISFRDFMEAIALTEGEAANG